MNANYLNKQQQSITGLTNNPDMKLTGAGTVELIRYDDCTEKSGMYGFGCEDIEEVKTILARHARIEGRYIVTSVPREVYRY